MFDKLKFRPHPMGEGVQATRQFDNDFVVSVVGGAVGLYGDGVNTFEVAVFDPIGDLYGDDVRGWLTPAEVSALMDEVKRLQA